MKRVLFYLTILVLVAIGVLLARLNADEITFHFYFSSVSAPLALLLYASVVIGAFSGVILTFGWVLHTRREAVRLRKKLHVCEQEIKNLREIPIKGQL